MCGRVKLSTDFSEIKIAFRIPPERPAPNFAPSWNVAPTDSLPIVRYDAKAGERSLDLMRWGLVPYWAKDMKIGFSTINARAEDVETKPAFREAFKRRRCLVPVDNFYEWKAIDAKTKQPYAIALADRSVMALAGLWENWKSPAEEWVHQLHDHHHDAERTVRADPQPHAGDPATRDVAGLAWRGSRGAGAAQDAACAVPGRSHDVLAGERAGWQRQEQRSVAGRASCIAPSEFAIMASV